MRVKLRDNISITEFNKVTFGNDEHPIYFDDIKSNNLEAQEINKNHILVLGDKSSFSFTLGDFKKLFEVIK